MLLRTPGSSTPIHVISTRITKSGYESIFQSSSYDCQLLDINRSMLHAIGTATVDTEVIWDFPRGVDATWWEPYRDSWEMDLKHLRLAYKYIPRDDIAIWVVFPERKR